jgi:formylglycine-generating enzyme required for sulfatase activity
MRLISSILWQASLCLLVQGLLAGTVAAADYIVIPAGSIVSVLSGPEGSERVPVRRFSLRETPVTNAEFQSFVGGHPEWRRDRVASIFADKSYLQSWTGPASFGNGLAADQPITNVSWFAAEAYCESEAARLPTWYEWEYVAAADEKRADARSDPQWRARILAWYGKTSEGPLPAVGGVANIYGIRDVHGLVWEWVDDFNALFISADSRNQGDPDKLQFCGAGAISLQDKDNFAILMRIALLSSLNGADTTGNLGFRCARSLSEDLK